MPSPTPGTCASRSRAAAACSWARAIHASRPPGCDSTHSIAAAKPVTVTGSAEPPSTLAAVVLNGADLAVVEGEVAGQRGPEPGDPVGLHPQAAAALRPQQPLLPGERVVVDPRSRARAGRCCRPTGRRPPAAAPPWAWTASAIGGSSSVRPVVHSTWEIATIRVRGPIDSSDRVGLDGAHDDAEAAGEHVHRAEDAGVLLGGGHDPRRRPASRARSSPGRRPAWSRRSGRSPRAVSRSSRS